MLVVISKLIWLVFLRDGTLACSLLLYCYCTFMITLKEQDKCYWWNNIVKAVSYRKESFGFSSSNPKHKSQPQEQWLQHLFHNFLISNITLSSKRLYSTEHWILPSGAVPVQKNVSDLRNLLSILSTAVHFPAQSQISLTGAMQSLPCVRWKWKSLKREGQFRCLNTAELILCLTGCQIFAQATTETFCARQAATGVKDHLTLSWEQNLNKTQRSMVFLYPSANPLPMLPRMPWLLSGKL